MKTRDSPKAHRPAGLGHRAANSRDPTLNKAKEEDCHLRMSSDLHIQTMAHESSLSQNRRLKIITQREQTQKQKHSRYCRTPLIFKILRNSECSQKQKNVCPESGAGGGRKRGYQRVEMFINLIVVMCLQMCASKLI